MINKRNSSGAFRAVLIAGSLALGGCLLFSGCSPKTASEDASELLTMETTYYEGITIEGIPVGGMTRQQALNALSGEVQAMRSAVRLTLPYDGVSQVLTGADLNLEDNLEQVLEEALLLGHSGSKSENKKVIESLAESGRNFEITFTCSESAAQSAAAALAAQIDTPAVEPVIESVSAEEVVFSGGTDGVAVNQAQLAQAILQAIAEGNYTAQLEIPLTVVPPVGSLEDLKAHTTFVSSYTTEFKNNSSNESRVHNIVKAAEMINGLVLQSGESFAFNSFVGERNKANGWEQAHVIVNGSSYEDDWGGGICQVSSTLYGAVLRADLQIDSRRRHSIPSDYVPKGQDATVDYASGKDFSFTNNTDYPVYIFASIDLSGKTATITFSIYGAPVADGMTIDVRSETVETLEPGPDEIMEDETAPAGTQTEIQKPRKGYIVDVYKDYLKDGVVVRSEKLYTDTYKSVNGIYSVGVAGQVDLPSEEGGFDEVILPEE